MRERWFDPYLKRGTKIPLATQEKHLEEARRRGVQCIRLLADSVFDQTAPAAASLAARAARRARPDLFE